MEHRNGRRLLRAAFPLLEPPGGEDAILLEHALGFGIAVQHPRTLGDLKAQEWQSRRDA